MDQAKVTEILSNVLTQLSLKETDINIDVADEDNVSILITPPPETAGVFVGHHGEGLAALRMIFSLMIYQRFSVWPKLHLNVNDYQERREDSLKELAQNAADRAVSLQKEIILPNLSSFERRIIHLFLEEYKGVRTESRGEPPLRQMVIIPTGE
ncbi:MAG: Single-stranded nucleic acid binding R3H domain protein [Candidatus Collierbacteria bacterium GW2011_GWB1_45_35]|uniref:Single-stranded nucleic acid binding R3H domain protein n=2 Tax=Candidatus Collieribacteriota TaxID=1752725 RepID=A0A0G1KSN5_9BACT|nr:MAG: Single-stranded nucleic acid binding R3H domain protein [Microgenomates group bacterium GW2011_GWC1_44_23]KKT86530.1 MAG: Single-stranded nucleic acid binding R3H domain protein [Candidatus Collierbacteria bacterium GW2011_GWA2_44_99]KKT96050.1 MAG: Single-stranded nucleic acid binding R3H domain protein [Candidatus Collierbacteria bacterium GW2011_GWA1_45_15]KKU01076.1 MAG: Single-stranded nucleic acid binding R3H domain protein [Candidatus Collierbacteria bacterium GW2011_GWB2_45_17]K